MYKVFPVEGGYEIFWCPFAPTHFNDKISYDGKIYSTRPAAYRRVKQLNDAKQKEREKGNVTDAGKEKKEPAA